MMSKRLRPDLGQHWADYFANPSVNRSTNGEPPGSGRWYAVHFYCDCRLTARREARNGGGFVMPNPKGGWNVMRLSR